jgi:hypothetical protein
VPDGGDDVPPEQAHLPDRDRYLVGTVAVDSAVLREAPEHLGDGHPAPGEGVDERHRPGQALVDPAAADLRVVFRRLPAVPVGQAGAREAADDAPGRDDEKDLPRGEFGFQFRPPERVRDRGGELVDELADSGQREQRRTGDVDADDGGDHRREDGDEIGLGGVGPVGLVDESGAELPGPFGVVLGDVPAEITAGRPRQERLDAAARGREPDDRRQRERGDQRHQPDRVHPRLRDDIDADRREDGAGHGRPASASPTSTPRSSTIAATSSGSA